MNDFSGNILKIPHYVAYCLTRIKKRYYRLLVSDKNKEKMKEEKRRIKEAIMRLFFKNLVAKLLKRLSADNHNYLKQMLDYKEDPVGLNIKQLFE